MAGTYDGSIRINTSLETAGFNKGASAIIGNLKKIAGLLGAAFSVAALVKFGKQAVELASDITEVDNVVSKAFGSMRGQMDALADSAIKNLGMSRLTAYQTGSTFMSMGKSMLDSSEDAATMAIELTKLTGNMSSFYNKSQDLVSLALKSVYTGETETLKQYGIVMTEVNLKQFALEQGITKAYSAMTQSEKVMLRYKYVMQQTAFIGDDFLDTQDSWANQTRILKEQWKEFLSVVGTGLITVLTPVVKALNNIVGALITFANTVGTVLSKIFGIKAQSFGVADSAQSAADSYDDAADAATGYGEAASDAADETAKAAKKMKGSLSGIDELNTINTSDSSSGSGTSGGSTGGGISSDALETETSLMEEATSKWEEQIGKIKDIWQSLADIAVINFKLTWEGLNVGGKLKNIKNNLVSIGDSLKDIFTDQEVQKSAENFAETFVASMSKTLAAFASIGATIGEAITGGIAIYLSENKDKIAKAISKIFDVSSEYVQAVSDFWVTLADLFSVIGGENMQRAIASILDIIYTTLGGAVILVTEIATDIVKAITKPFSENMGGIKQALDGFVGFIASVLGTAQSFVNDFVESVISMYEESIRPFVDNVASGISQIVGAVVDGWNTHIQPVLDVVGEDIKKIYDNYIKPIMKNVISVIGDVIYIIGKLWKNVIAPLVSWIASNVMPIIAPVLSALWKAVGGENGVITKILKIIKKVSKVVADVVSIIRDIIDGDWKSAWNTAKSIVKGVVNGIIGLFEGMVNRCIDAINAILSPLRNIASLGATAMNAIFGTSFTVPNGFSHIKLPRLANGGITTGSTLANIGEAGREAVLPLENNLGYLDAFAEKIASKINGSATVRIVPDDRNIFKVVVEQEKHNYNMTGNPVFVH